MNIVIKGKTYIENFLLELGRLITKDKDGFIYSYATVLNEGYQDLCKFISSYVVVTEKSNKSVLELKADLKELEKEADKCIELEDVEKLIDVLIKYIETERQIHLKCYICKFSE